MLQVAPFERNVAESVHGHRGQLWNALVEGGQDLQILCDEANISSTGTSQFSCQLSFLGSKPPWCSGNPGKL